MVKGGFIIISISSEKIKPGSKQARVVLLLGLFAAGLFYADAFITPAISVLSAIEGTELITIQFKSWIIPITISVLIMLFLFQRYGTQKIGGLLFGPIMIIWFLTLGILGLKEIFINPAVLYAFNPFYAVQFFLINPKKVYFYSRQYF
jgi:KUP system potassium uptake protein